jgi:chaperonin GroEL
MAVKELAFDADARKALLSGVEKLSAAVKSTLGPRGRSAVLDKSWGGPTVTKDGVTVAEEIELRNRVENMGAQLVKEAASKTSEDAGDGTTTATILAEALFKGGLKHVTAGVEANALVRGMQKAVDAVVDRIESMAKPVADNIAAVATISANNDFAVGKIMAEAFHKVGKDGVITVEEGKGLDTYVDVVEGMQFDRGYLSPNFITNAEQMSVELDKPLILIHEEKIDSVTKLVPFLEKVMGAKKPLLIIAEDVSGEALSTLVINKLRGVLQVAAVKAPGYGDRRKAMLEDIAVLTGADPVMKDLGIELDKVGLKQLGQAKKIDITADSSSARPRRSISRPTTAPSSRVPAPPGTSRTALPRSATRSRPPTRTTTGRSSRSGWPSSPAASPRSTWARPARRSSRRRRPASRTRYTPRGRRWRRASCPGAASASSAPSTASSRCGSRSRAMRNSAWTSWARP